MEISKLGPTPNQLMRGLPVEQRLRLLGQCEPVNLAFGEILCEPEQSIRHAYFPVTGFISLVTSLSAHPPLEMGLIGSEGMLGSTLILGVPEAPMRAVVQGAGKALRISAVELMAQIRDSPYLAARLSCYLYILNAQLTRSAACTHFHTIDHRLARWLLMTHDRAHSNQFFLTHKFLANMLGVQRSGITIAAGVLQDRKVIAYARGHITVLDREALEAASCKCYEAMISEYARLIPGKDQFH